LFDGSARISMIVSERDSWPVDASAPLRWSKPTTSAVAGCEGVAIGWRFLSFEVSSAPALCAPSALSVSCP